MLRILSRPRTLCNGQTRRELLEVGAAGVLGLGIDALLAATAASREQVAAAESPAPAGFFGRAKHCILLYLYGAPSQLETFDMKPRAEAEVRGEMQPIPSNVPGLFVCEHLPETARVMDRVSVVRSMTHPYPIHGVAYATTGVPTIDVAAELNPYDVRHHPYFASVVQFLDQKRRNGRRAAVPQNVALPFPFSSKRSDQPLRAGPYAAYLGAAYNPLWTEFVGEGTKVITKSRAGGFSFTGPEPYLGCTPNSHFRIGATGALPHLTLDRLHRRRSLLQQLDTARRQLQTHAAVSSFDQFQQAAFSLIDNPRVAEALDVRRERDSIRRSYGMTLFGQAALAARRLIEAGTRVVSVFWDEYGLAGDAWDTHANHFPRMKEQLLPGFDKAFAGLIRDLDARGLLDETLVMVLSEHGRTPKIDSKPAGAGRHHWSRAYSIVLAGGGIARGRVIGATDRHAADVADNPISPKDILATAYHLLGIAPHTTLPDRTNRPIPLVPHESRVVSELFG